MIEMTQGKTLIEANMSQTKIKQVTARPTLPIYQALSKYCEAKGLTESQGICDLLERFFDGGYQRSAQYRLKQLNTRIKELSNA